ncbi:MAG TPA: hypothetical protein PLI09_00385 [Candidatus Hydrogenedentes bacterium]|nr:hypothetical protein [Candidatus Hydrogenedentota bacterium]
MSLELERQIATEMEHLRMVLTRHPGLLEKCKSEPPTPIELDALANMLHGFYTGVENIFKRICIARGDIPKDGALSHIQMLQSMASTAQQDSPVLTQELIKTLREYMNFRHMFRHAYAHELKWHRMAALILDIWNVFNRLQKELNQYLVSIRGQ